MNFVNLQENRLTMISRFFLILICFICIANVFPQESKVDSLLAGLNTAPEEKKIDLYLSIADAYYYNSYIDFIAYSRMAKELAIKYNKPTKVLVADNSIAIGYNQMGVFDSALVYYKKVLDYVLADQDSMKIAITLRNLGIVHHSQGRTEQARDWYSQSIEIGKCINDSITIVRGLTSIASLYSDQGDYVEAIKIAFEALTFAEALGSLKMRSDILSNIGILNGKMGDYPKSLQYHLSSLRMDIETGDQRGISYALNNIGLVYKKMGMIDSAVNYYNRSLAIKRKLADRYGITSGLSNLGTIYKEEGKLDKALECYKEALLIADSANLVLEKARLLSEKASVLVEKRQFNQAKKDYLESLNIALQENLQEDIRDNYKGLAELYERNGDLSKSVKFLKRYSNIKDSLLNESNQRSIAEMQTRYETEKKEKEIQILTQNTEIQNLKLKKQRTQMWLLVGTVLFLFVIAFFVFSSYRLRQQNYRTALEKKNLETEQRMLRSQMNPHFIFNSMNSIQSYISGNDNFTAMTYLSKFAQLMRGILENSRQVMITLQDEINTLNLYVELEQLRFRNKFEFKLHVDPDLFPETTFIPPMLVQPFAENAIKHGLKNNGDNGLLNIGFSKKDGLIECVIQDNGIGREKANALNENYNKDHQSLGMQVTRERLTALSTEKRTNSSFEITDLKNRNGESEGTRVIIKMPFENE